VSSADLSQAELARLRDVARVVDDLLEASLRERENLEQTFKRLFHPLMTAAGARGVAVTAVDEHLGQKTWHLGDFGGVFPGSLIGSARFATRKLTDGNTLVSQALDVAGTQVGFLGLVFDGDRTDDGPALARLVDAIAEQLDTVLASVQTAAEKHQLLVTINRHLSNRVFDVGLDAAVGALCGRVRLPTFLIVHRDVVHGSRLLYRRYTFGNLSHASNGNRHDRLEEAIRVQGGALVDGDDEALFAAMNQPGSREVVRVQGPVGEATLAKLVAWGGPNGFSAYVVDMLRLLASTLSQRLVDYHRERTHLAQFFSVETIDNLLRDPDYERRYLLPRSEEVGILFTDINGFTRICEQVLEKPERIGAFVDDWSTEAVRIVHRHGGVFDKMVGDCIIGLFGPPFFDGPPARRAAAALRAAIEIQAYTREVASRHPALADLKAKLRLPGLGVATGVNLAPSYCGLFGPNRNYTAFSTGMNQTARLQALGGFRQTLIMESAHQALVAAADPVLGDLTFGGVQESAVKNVAQPLRYLELLDG
jgi:adenylate cyclase